MGAQPGAHMVSMPGGLSGLIAVSGAGRFKAPLNADMATATSDQNHAMAAAAAAVQANLAAAAAANKPF